MAAVSVNEQELLQLLRDHLQQTGQVESMWALESRTGVQPAKLFPEEKALRRLVALGRWEYVHFFLLPLKDKEGYSYCQFLLHRQELLELLCSRPDKHSLYETQVQEAMLRLQQSCPTKDQFMALSYLLSLSRLQDDPNYQEWNPPKSRLQLFHVLANFLRSHVYPKASPIPITQTTGGSRLARLVTRGLLYEKCEEFFKTQQQTNGGESVKAMDLWHWLQQQPDSLFLAQPPCISLTVASQPSPVEGCGSSHHKSLTYLSLDACQEQREESFLSRSVPCNLCFHWTHGISPMHQADTEHTFTAPPTRLVTPPPCVLPSGGVVSSTPKMKNETAHTVAPPSSPINYIPGTHGINDTPCRPISTSRTVKLHQPYQPIEEESWPKLLLTAVVTDTQVVRSVAFSDSGKLLAVGSNSRTLGIYSTAHLPSSKIIDLLPLVHQEQNYHRGSIYSLAWFKDLLLASGSNDQTVRLFYREEETGRFTGQEVLRGHRGTVRDLLFLSDGRLVSCGAGDHSVLVTDCHTHQRLASLCTQPEQMLALTALDENTVASGGMDGTVRFWDLRSSFSPSLTLPISHPITSLSAYGQSLACATQDGQCQIWDLATRTCRGLATAHSYECRSIRYSPDGRLLLSGAYDGSICLIRPSNLCWTQVCSHPDKVIQCRWHPSGTAIASSGADHRACLWVLQPKMMS